MNQLKALISAAIIEATGNLAKLATLEDVLRTALEKVAKLRHEANQIEWQKASYRRLS
jgi:hypothetical protein